MNNIVKEKTNNMIAGWSVTRMSEKSHSSGAFLFGENKYIGDLNNLQYAI